MKPSSITIANKFIHLALKENNPTNALRLQKLVFIANGFYLGLRGEPLMENSINLTRWGPMIPVLYEALRSHKLYPIKTYIVDRFWNWDLELNDDQMSVINAVYEIYNKLSDIELSSIICNEDLPWMKQKLWSEIPMFVIKDYYLNLVIKEYENYNVDRRRN